MDLLRSLPIGLYLEHPITWLHHLDPRVKLFWLMGFLLTPVLANSYWRVGLVLGLFGITLAASIPFRVWQRQMGWWMTLVTLVLALTIVSPDGLPANHQPHRPPYDRVEALPPAKTEASEAENPETAPVTQVNLEDLPPAIGRYRYVLWKKGRLTITRRSLDLGIRISTLIFTLIYSTNLYLLTTSPEEITAGLEDLMLPLRRLRWPVTEIVLTLTLALRFIPLVMEECQNLVRSIWTRAINWKKLGLRRGIKVWLQVGERLLQNLLLRAEQIAGAIQVRGFTSPDQHRVQWHDLRLKDSDRLALLGLVLFWSARFVWGNL